MKAYQFLQGSGTQFFTKVTIAAKLRAGEEAHLLQIQN